MSYDLLVRDVRFAFRLLARERTFALIAITVLGMGIGVANMMFVLVNAFCLRGLPISGVDRVLFLGTRDTQGRDAPLSYRELEVIQSGMDAFTGLAGFSNAALIIGDSGRAPDRATGTYVSAGAFRVLAERPALGRDFELADDRPGAAPVVILGDRLWKSRYNADPSIIGRAVRVNGAVAVVVGVMAPGFRFPGNTDVWQPLAVMPGVLTDARARRSLSVIGRMTPGATIVSVRERLGSVGAQLSLDYAESNRGTTITAIPINERYNARITDPTWLAFMSVGVIVLLIACANAANLLLMRAVRRSHEMAVRTSIGASRARLVQQLLAENAVLAAFGAAAGTALSLLGVRILTRVIPADTLAYFTRFTMDGRAFGVLLGVTLGTVFLFGLAPALHVSRTDVTPLMKSGGSTTGVKTRRWTVGLLTVEMGLTMVLLAALALGVRIARGTDRAATVVDPAGRTTASIALPASRYRSDEEKLAFYRELAERHGRVPGVSAVAITTALPLAGGAARRLSVEGRAVVDAGSAPTAWTVTVSERYFDAMGLALLRGRGFTERDGTPGNESVIVNQRLAAALFPLGDAVGHRIALTDPSSKDTTLAWLTIVGVSPTVRQRPVAEPDFVAYVPLRRAPPGSAIVVVRSRVDDPATGRALRETVRAIDPELPLYQVKPMDRALLDVQWNARLTKALLNTFAFAAVFLAAAGLYAVSAHAVIQRKREIGIRMALGARDLDVVGSVVRRAAVQLGLGLVAGVGASWGFERLLGLGADAFGYHLSDPVTLVAAATLMAAITALACVGPAYRAARLDPVQALRVRA